MERYEKASDNDGVLKKIQKKNEDKETQRILTSDKNEYTESAEQVIQASISQFPFYLRQKELNKALDERNKERFSALASEDWKITLGITHYEI
ncbi:hypothetical protein CN918_26155 [Priestia megaterium]|nr:hypothetical protein CN918_26155 [Priestia megaterium]